jgi:hypothetical protein
MPTIRTRARVPRVSLRLANAEEGPTKIGVPSPIPPAVHGEIAIDVAIATVGWIRTFASAEGTVGCRGISSWLLSPTIRSSTRMIMPTSVEIEQLTTGLIFSRSHVGLGSSDYSKLCLTEFTLIRILNNPFNTMLV